MKKFQTILSIFVILTAHSACGQGSGIVTFSNVGAAPTDRISVIEGGVLGYASGTAYAIALYWGGPAETDERNMVQVGARANFLTGASAGTFFGGGRTINAGSVNGPVLTFQARAWCTRGGTVTTYEQALISDVITGKGPVFSLKTKDPTNPLEVTPSIGQAAGWTGFYVMSLDGGHICIPEPSTVALCVLGATALLLLRRKRS
jgi:hypothetical protein